MFGFGIGNSAAKKSIYTMQRNDSHKLLTWAFRLIVFEIYSKNSRKEYQVLKCKHLKRLLKCLEINMKLQDVYRRNNIKRVKILIISLNIQQDNLIMKNV